MANNAPREPVPARPQAGFDASNPEQVHAREKASRALEQRKVAGLRLLLDHPDGRAWLWDLIGFCGVYRTSFTGNSETFMREGQRNVGLKIHAELLKHFPESYMTMMKEGANNAV